jgi:nucleotide-binding universal stress UspA family protein
MVTIKHILVGLAGTMYTPVAIQRAVRLAQSHDAEVTGVIVLDAKRIRYEGIGLMKVPKRELMPTSWLRACV